MNACVIWWTSRYVDTDDDIRIIRRIKRDMVNVKNTHSNTTNTCPLNQCIEQFIEPTKNLRILLSQKVVQTEYDWT